MLSRSNGRAYSRKGGICGLNITDNIKSDGFAFPGDVSLTLNMTYFVCVILNAVKNLPEGWYFSEFI